MLGVDDPPNGLIRVCVESVVTTQGCPQCGVAAHVKGRDQVELVDLPLYGHGTRLVWHKRRLRCPDPDCPKGSWTEQNSRICAPRLSITDRAGRWITKQVGENGRNLAAIIGVGNRVIGASDFLPATTGDSIQRPGFSLQARAREPHRGFRLRRSTVRPSPWRHITRPSSPRSNTRVIGANGSIGLNVSSALSGRSIS